MPSYEFTGLTPMTYPESRDAAGIPIGTVQPGDIRDLDEPLDHLWVPAGSKPVKRRKAAGQDDPAPQTPASDPGTTGSGSDEAGDSGSKES